MKKLYFWNEWHAPYKHLYWLFFILFIISLLFGVYNYLVGEHQVISWELVNKLDQLKLIAHTVNAGIFKLEIPLDNYVVFQYFRGSNLVIVPWNGYVYLLLLFISVNLIMATMTTMPKLWFYAGMGGFIGFAVLLNIDQIMLFGRMDKTALIIILTLYLSAGYFFREISTHVSLTLRVLTFCVISVIIAVIFGLYAEVDDPFLYIANYGITASVIISVLFIVFVAHEIIYGFLYLITNSNTAGSSNSLTHFIVISVFFLAYVGVTYLYYTGQVSWDLIYLNPFLLAGITFVIGIWGYRKREDLFKEIFGFYPVGALFYLGFGIISIATLSYIFSSANDPLMETFEDVILYSQIGFGMLFFIYVVSNFSPLLLKNMKVSKIVYQSRGFPFFLFRIGGLLVFGFIFYSSNFLPFHQAMAGYYNYVGDLFLIQNQLGLAEEYYNEASKYEFQNHRSNYAMATLARLQEDKYDEAYYFSNALLKQPTAFSYINLSNIYLNNDQYFDGLFQLRDGFKEFPSSPQILNNMGYFYSRTDITDSAFYFFDQSVRESWNGAVPASNIYALFAKARINIAVDSLREDYDPGKEYAGIANQLAMENQFQQPRKELPPPEVRDDYKRDHFAMLYNYGLQSLTSPRTIYFDQLKAYGDSSGMDLFRSRMSVLSAMNSYFNNQVMKAFRTLYEIGEMSLLNDEYFNILGALALEMGSPRLAVDYFMRTSVQTNEQYKLNLGIAYAEAGMLPSAEEVFNELLNSSDASIRVISELYAGILEWDLSDQTDSLDDERKYLLFHLRARDDDAALSEELIASVENHTIRSLMRTEKAERFLKKRNLVMVNDELEQLEESKMPPGLLTRILRIQYLLAIHAEENPESSGEKVRVNDLPDSGTDELSTNDPLFLHRQLYHLQQHSEMQDTVLTDSLYHMLATWNPFFEKGVIAAVNYFSDDRDMENYAYNLLVGAVTFNEYSEVLNKYYIDFCVEDGLFDFARKRLEFMRGFMEDPGFSEYYERTSAEIAQKEEAINSWWE